MKKSIKAVLLSAFLFPGAGHIYLKRYVTGTALVVATAVAIYYLVGAVTDKAYQIVEQIERQGIPPDLATLTAAVSQQLSGAESRSLNLVTLAIAACWIVGILDSIRIGRAQDRRSFSDTH